MGRLNGITLILASPPVSNKTKDFNSGRDQTSILLLYAPPKNNCELGMNLVYKDGQGNNEAVVYEGASADGLSHTIRRANGTRLSVPDSNLAFLQQMGMHNIPSTPLEYCKKVGVRLTKEEAQRLAHPQT